MNKKLYISGKITGLPLPEAMAKFANTCAHAAILGFTPVNPFEVSPYAPEKVWADYMGDCIRELLQCDEILLLPDWHMSRGARIEYCTAREMGMPVRFWTADNREDSFKHTPVPPRKPVHISQYNRAV